jgi:hypothetical protein
MLQKKTHRGGNCADPLPIVIASVVKKNTLEHYAPLFPLVVIVVKKKHKGALCPLPFSLTAIIVAK